MACEETRQRFIKNSQEAVRRNNNNATEQQDGCEDKYLQKK